MLKGFRFLSLLLLLAVLVAPLASANSVSLGHVTALQNNGFTQVDLFANPGVQLHATSLSIPTQLSILIPFTGIVPSGSTDSMLISALILGSKITQNFSIPAGSYSNISQFVTFNFPTGILNATPVSLSVSLWDPNGQLLDSANYGFKFTEAVPEPGTMLLLGSGIVAAVVRKFRSAQ